MAIAGGYYADASGHGMAPYAQDDGSAIITALTKCDEDSWCSGLRACDGNGSYEVYAGAFSVAGPVSAPRRRR